MENHCIIEWRDGSGKTPCTVHDFWIDVRHSLEKLLACLSFLNALIIFVERGYLWRQSKDCLADLRILLFRTFAPIADRKSVV